MKGRDGSGEICCGGKNRKQNAAGVPEDKLEMESHGSCDSVSFVVALLIPSLPPGAPGLPWFTTYLDTFQIDVFSLYDLSNLDSHG